jgi:hypothetical protein
MKIALWTVAAGIALTLVACSHNNSGSTSSSTSGGSGTSGSAPTSSGAPTDFVAFVNDQVNLAPQPSFGSEPAVTTALTDLALGDPNSFGGVPFGTGDPAAAGTYSAATGCAQAGTSACNPAVSADLNSNLN